MAERPPCQHGQDTKYPCRKTAWLPCSQTLCWNHAPEAADARAASTVKHRETAKQKREHPEPPPPNEFVVRAMICWEFYRHLKSEGMSPEGAAQVTAAAVPQLLAGYYRGY